jgi:hypothetical protein
LGLVHLLWVLQSNPIGFDFRFGFEGGGKNKDNIIQKTGKKVVAFIHNTVDFVFGSREYVISDYQNIKKNHSLDCVSRDVQGCVTRNV